MDHISIYVIILQKKYNLSVKSVNSFILNCSKHLPDIRLYKKVITELLKSTNFCDIINKYV